jgi:hypothetical protein
LTLALAVNFALKIEVKASRPDASGCDDGVDYTRDDPDKNCYCSQHGFSDLSYCSTIVSGAIFSYSASFLTAMVNLLLASTISRTVKLQMWKSRSSEVRVEPGNHRTNMPPNNTGALTRGEVADFSPLRRGEEM